MPIEALVPRPDAPGQGSAWLRLAIVTRLVAVVVAGGLLTLRPFTDQDPVLAAAAVAWGLVTVTVMQRSRVALRPGAWLVDIAAALMLVLASGDWRSPFYVLALSSLILPAVMLPRQRAAGIAALFTLVYAAIAVVTGIDWATLGSTSRLESFSTHLLLPLMLVGLLAYAARLLHALAEARDRTERIRLEAERRRIGLELHDSAKQRIHAAHLVLSSLQGAQVNGDGSALTLAMQELRAAADEMDASVAELRTTLDGRRLEEALAGRAMELQQASGVPIRVHGTAGILPTFVAVHAYRVAAEAMTNAVRHAAARQVDVAVHADAERLQLVVTDDGEGLAGETADSTGIASMRARARTLGGRLELRDGAGAHGTTVLLDVPVRPAVPAEP
jgi:signal transduction histidine kinase